jgi:two-component system NarL family response regulator
MDAPAPEIRVVVADDSAAFRRTLCTYLAGFPQIRVVGEAADAVEAVVMTAKTHPDVVLLDLAMPRGGGSAAALRIKSAGIAKRVILVSLLGQRELALATRAAGADGFVCKADIDTELVPLLVNGEQPTKNPSNEEA